MEGSVNVSPPTANLTREGEGGKKPAPIPRCLDLRYGSAIETLVSGQLSVDTVNPRSQFLDRPEYRLAKLVQSPPIKNPVEDFTNISAKYPDVDAILSGDLGILNRCEPAARIRRTRGDIP